MAVVGRRPIPFEDPVHHPHIEVILWALCLLPFTLWDTAYIFLRPHSLDGHKWHKPFFVPMDPWTDVDRIYGTQAWDENEGFTAAQGVINMVEVMLLVTYTLITACQGRRFQERAFGGQWAGIAMVVGLTASVVTLTKTSLYCTLASPSV